MGGVGGWWVVGTKEGLGKGGSRGERVEELVAVRSGVGEKAGRVVEKIMGG